MWVRGLKHHCGTATEIFNVSHPMWVRGLKLPYIKFESTYRKSHPMWVRGLKQHWAECYHFSKFVAPYVGAWIETWMML